MRDGNQCSVGGFVESDAGAVTVDWVVLSGAVIAIAIGVVASIETSLEDAGGRVSAGVENARPTVNGNNYSISDN